MNGDSDRDVGFRAVGDGESAGLVAAYQAAARGALMLEGALTEAGLAEVVLIIVPGVNDAGEPVVRVALAVAGAALLADRLLLSVVPREHLRGGWRRGAVADHRQTAVTVRARRE